MKSILLIVTTLFSSAKCLT